jgi:putative transposase
MMYIRYPLSLRQVEDLLFERGIDICHETIRFWWNRFGPMFAAEIRKRRVHHQPHSRWRWHLDEVFVRINGEFCYLWRAVDHEGEVLEAYVTKKRDRKATLRFLRKAMKRYGRPEVVVTDRLRSYRAAMRVIGNAENQETGRWLNNRAENSHQHSAGVNSTGWLAPGYLIVTAIQPGRARKGRRLNSRYPNIGGVGVRSNPWALVVHGTNTAAPVTRPARKSSSAWFASASG